jgi:hypothetical protein
MTAHEFTLYAAAIAAVASMASALLAYRAGKVLDRNSAHREVLAASMENMGDKLYELVAFSKKMTEAKSDEGFDSKRLEAEASAHDVDGLRRRLRYPLWGLDPGFRTLKWLPIYIAHYKKNREGTKAQRMISMATRLRRALDSAIVSSYYAGRPPGLVHQWRVRYHAWRLRRQFGQDDERGQD